jgi:DNA-directed RNA polymerase subunit K/omega
MEYKKVRTGTAAITRNLNDFDQETGNIYETLVVLSKRANQIAVDLKEELTEKLQEFSTSPTAAINEVSDEIFENKEQVEAARQYEQLPKPSLLATQEFLNGQVYFRLTEEDEE